MCMHVYSIMHTLHVRMYIYVRDIYYVPISNSKNSSEYCLLPIKTLISSQELKISSSRSILMIIAFSILMLASLGSVYAMTSSKNPSLNETVSLSKPIVVM